MKMNMISFILLVLLVCTLATPVPDDEDDDVEARGLFDFNKQCGHMPEKSYKCCIHKFGYEGCITGDYSEPERGLKIHVVFEGKRFSITRVGPTAKCHGHTKFKVCVLSKDKSAENKGLCIYIGAQINEGKIYKTRAFCFKTKDGAVEITETQ